jgi:hypothetical protein
MAATREPGLVRADAGENVRHLLLPADPVYSIRPPSRRDVKLLWELLFIASDASGDGCEFLKPYGFRTPFRARTATVKTTNFFTSSPLSFLRCLASESGEGGGKNTEGGSYAERRKSAACHESFARRSHAPLRTSPRRCAVVSKTIVSSLATFRSSPRGTPAIAPLASR